MSAPSSLTALPSNLAVVAALLRTIYDTGVTSRMACRARHTAQAEPDNAT
jgi:hypothetical protein